MTDKKKQPNIIFILADDQGAWATHHAGISELQTPTLDQLAEEGVRCDNFFCVSPVCSPARASLLTGQIPSAHGVHDWIRSGSVDGQRFAEVGRKNPYAGGYAEEGRPIQYLANRQTYTDLLAINGYQCALSGKWHLGDSLVAQHGFDHWITLGKGGCSYYYPDVVRDGQITIEEGRYVTELITDQALTMLDEMKAKAPNQPFYLSVHYTAPHSPWEAEQHPSKWIDYYDSCDFESIPDRPDHPDMTTGPVYGTAKRHQNLRGYFAAISAMDEQIGRLLDYLQEHGLREETVVIFTADNGMSMGHHGIWGKGNGTYPMNMYDSAVKVPFIISYPMQLPSGRLEHQLLSAYDLFPTILELAGIVEEEGPEKKWRPGRSFWQTLQKTETESERMVVVYDEYGPVRMIRNREWKYIHRYPYGKHELYDLVNDPDENINLIEVEDYKTKVVELRCQMESWFEQYRRAGVDGLYQAVKGGGQTGLAGLERSQVDIYPVNEG